MEFLLYLFVGLFGLLLQYLIIRIAVLDAMKTYHNWKKRGGAEQQSESQENINLSQPRQLTEEQLKNKAKNDEDYHRMVVRYLIGFAIAITIVVIIAMYYS